MMKNLITETERKAEQKYLRSLKHMHIILGCVCWKDVG
jgi:hypothetical protein